MPYPLEHDPLASALGEALIAREQRVAVAETTAGGLISARMLSVPGASAWFDRGVIAYSGPAKRDSLQLNVDILREHGAVSPAAVAEMARALCELAGVAWCVAESGIAGPQGSRRSPKPAGTVVIAVEGPDVAIAEECFFEGSRAQVMEQISERALAMLLTAIRGE